MKVDIIKQNNSIYQIKITYLSYASLSDPRCFLTSDWTSMVDMEISDGS